MRRRGASSGSLDGYVGVVDQAVRDGESQGTPSGVRDEDEDEDEWRWSCGADAEAADGRGGAGTGEWPVQATVAVPGLQARGQQHCRAPRWSWAGAAGRSCGRRARGRRLARVVTGRHARRPDYGPAERLARLGARLLLSGEPAEALARLVRDTPLAVLAFAAGGAVFSNWSCATAWPVYVVTALAPLSFAAMTLPAARSAAGEGREGRRRDRVLQTGGLRGAAPLPASASSTRPTPPTTGSILAPGASTSRRLRPGRGRVHAVLVWKLLPLAEGYAGQKTKSLNWGF